MHFVRRVFLQLQSTDQDGHEIDMGCNSARSNIGHGVQRRQINKSPKLEHMSERVTFFIMLGGERRS